MKNRKNKKMTLEKLALMIGKGFNETDKKFGLMNQRFDALTGEMSKNFKEVNQKINNISLNIVDIVRQKDFDELKDRVTDVEEVLDLKLKKA